MKKQKGLNPIITIIILGVVVAIIIAVFLSTQKIQQTAQVQSPTPSVPAIQGPNDLNATTADLDNIDLIFCSDLIGTDKIQWFEQSNHSGGNSLRKGISKEQF